MQRALLLLHHHFVTAFLRGDVAWLSSCKLYCSELCNFWENRSACKNVFSILLFRLMTVIPPSLPPLASLETEEYFGRRTIMILGCCSCCCVFGPSFSSSERGSWTTSKEAAAVQTTTVGEALQKLLPKERRVVHKGFHYGFSGNRFIHYSLFAWNRYIFFLFKKYKKCYHLLHWKIERERESPHIGKNRACSCSQEKEEEEEEDVHQVRFVVGPFFVTTSGFVEGELFPESSSQCFNPGVWQQVMWNCVIVLQHTCLLLVLGFCEM